jgi:hypothetical protein
MQAKKMKTIGPDFGKTNCKLIYVENFKDTENEKNTSDSLTVHCVSSGKYSQDKTANSTNLKESYLSNESQILTLNQSGQKNYKDNNTLKNPRHNSSAKDLRSSSPVNYDDEKYNKLAFRKDRRGVPIIKGGKRHKVSFADGKLVDKILVERVKVESFKSHNVGNTYSEDKPYENTNENCCIVI